jgi:hypothetical protein
MKPFSQLFLLAIFAVGVRCDGYVVHKCQDTARTTITTYEFVANETDVRLQNIDESKSVNLVIENEEDYDHYVVQNNPAVPRPTIDFSKKCFWQEESLIPDVVTF